jgi:hypothetical protein
MIAPVAVSRVSVTAREMPKSMIWGRPAPAARWPA